MGLFSSILEGFGLEDTPKATYIKPRKKTNINNKYDTFNLHKKEGQTKASNSTNTFNMQESNLAIYAPISHADVQKIVLSLKLKEACIVNLENIVEHERQRVLDFFSGALFALGGDIARLQGDLFLVTPKSVNIKVN